MKHIPHSSLSAYALDSVCEIVGSEYSWDIKKVGLSRDLRVAMLNRYVNRYERERA
jgi:hypothetical protein